MSGQSQHQPGSLTHPAFLFVCALALIHLPTPSVHAASFPSPSGRFTFDGAPFVGTASLTNTITTNKCLYLNGRYFLHYDYHRSKSDGQPSTAIFRPLVLNYNQFSVATRLMPQDLSNGSTLLVGGTSSRWFVLRADPSGKLELTFNNHDLCRPISNLTLTNGQWITLALTFNIPSRKVVLYANGRKVDQLVLPKDFSLNITKYPTWKDADKVLTFTDYANGVTFYGLIAGLLTFDCELSPAQASTLFPPRDARQSF